MKKYKVISLFSGAGGLDLGFINEGHFQIDWANDFEQDAVNTYKKNIGNHIICGDITKIPSSDIPDNPDVVLGGFPCQGFSVANIKRNMKDQRNFLYLEMVRIIKDKKPKFFVAENVKGLLSMEHGEVIKMIVKDFEKLGYKVDYKVLKASEYGVPQNRERVIIMGNNQGLPNVFPKPKYHDPFPKELTVKENIKFLQDAPLNPKEFKWKGQIIKNHIASENVKDSFWKRKYDVSQEEICDYLNLWRTKSGWSKNAVEKHFGYKYKASHWFRKDNHSGTIPNPDEWRELKKMFKFDDRYDKVVTTFEKKNISFEQSLRVTNWDTPSDTITASQPEIHVNGKRRLSVREAAILQTFPMDFEFTGALGKMYRQVGNAVPPLLGTQIAHEIYKSLDKEEKQDEKKIIRHRTRETRRQVSK